MLDFNAHVKFNCQGSPTKNSQATIGAIAKEMTNLVPNMVLQPSHTYHVTFGQSSYFDKGCGDDKQMIMLPIGTPSIETDYNNILAHLQSGLAADVITEICDATVTGVRISQHGFVIYTLDSPMFAGRIADLYQRSSIQATFASDTRGFLGLTSFYEVDSPFDMHITVGKIADLNTKEHDQAVLSANFARGRDPMSKIRVEFEPMLWLDASFRKGKHYIDIYKQNIPMQGEAPQRRMVLFSQPQQPLNSFGKDLLAVLPAVAPAAPTVAEIEDGINNVYPNRAFTLMLPNQTRSGKYEIIFTNQRDQKSFANTFSKRFMGTKGLCRYLNAKDAGYDSNDHRIIMDETAVHTLVGRNPQAQDNYRKPLAAIL